MPAHHQPAGPSGRGPDPIDVGPWRAEAIVDACPRLISLPEIYLRARQALEDPRGGLDRLGDILCQDPALAARLLKIANSALYGVRAQIGSVHQAVTLIGSRQVSELLLATEIARSFRGVSSVLANMDVFWESSLYTAALCSVLGRGCGGAGGDSLFVTGLLHEIGHLLMFSAAPVESAQALEHAGARADELPGHEVRFVGCHYAAVGGELLRRWQLPAYLVRPVAQHLEPLGARDYVRETAILHLAAGLAHADGPGVEPAERRASLDARVLERAGLTAAQCEAARLEAEPIVGSMLALIFAGQGSLA